MISCACFWLRRLSDCMSLFLAAWVDGCPQIGVGGCLCCFVAWGIILISITSQLPLYHRHFRSFVFPCCGFFPLQSRVDSFHSAAQCRRLCFAQELNLSGQVACVSPAVRTSTCIVYVVVSCLPSCSSVVSGDDDGDCNDDG